MGERSTSSHHGLPCLPRYASGHTLSLAKDQGCTQMHVCTESSSHTYCAGRRLRSREIEQNTLSCQYIVIFFSSVSPSPICLLLRSLASSLPEQRGAQPAKTANCLRRPFLVSKQVVLFSIPVSTEMAIICPLKRSHTRTHTHAHCGAMLEKLAREIVEADLAEKITNDLSQQNTESQPNSSSSSSSALRFSFLSDSSDIINARYMQVSQIEVLYCCWTGETVIID